MANHICHCCGKKMRQQNVLREFSVEGRDPVTLSVTVFMCPSCGEEIYEDKEVRKIDRQLRRGGRDA